MGSCAKEKMSRVVLMLVHVMPSSLDSNTPSSAPTRSRCATVESASRVRTRALPARPETGCHAAPNCGRTQRPESAAIQSFPGSSLETDIVPPETATTPEASDHESPASLVTKRPAPDEANARFGSDGLIASGCAYCAVVSVSPLLRRPLHVAPPSVERYTPSGWFPEGKGLASTVWQLASTATAAMRSLARSCCCSGKVCPPSVDIESAEIVAANTVWGLLGQVARLRGDLVLG